MAGRGTRARLVFRTQETKVPTKCFHEKSRSWRQLGDGHCVCPPAPSCGACKQPSTTCSVRPAAANSGNCLSHWPHLLVHSKSWGVLLDAAVSSVRQELRWGDRSECTKRLFSKPPMERNPPHIAILPLRLVRSQTSPESVLPSQEEIRFANGRQSP